MPPDTKQKMENLLVDAESAMMDIEEKFSELAAIGDLIDEELAA
jgi:hypothetical protein